MSAEYSTYNTGSATHGWQSIPLLVTPPTEATYGIMWTPVQSLRESLAHKFSEPITFCWFVYGSQVEESSGAEFLPVTGFYFFQCIRRLRQLLQSMTAPDMKERQRSPLILQQQETLSMLQGTHGCSWLRRALLNTFPLEIVFKWMHVNTLNVASLFKAEKDVANFATRRKELTTTRGMSKIK